MEVADYGFNEHDVAIRPEEVPVWQSPDQRFGLTILLARSERGWHAGADLSLPLSGSSGLPNRKMKAFSDRDQALRHELDRFSDLATKERKHHGDNEQHMAAARKIEQAVRDMLDRLRQPSLF